jgi:hypothetical protein
MEVRASGGVRDVRITYRPDRTKHWTGAELAAMVGKYVAVDIPASPEFKTKVGGDFEGASGVCERAAIGRFDLAFVEFDDGTGWNWDRNAGAWVGVCDEHGDHTSLNGVVCLETLGAPR